MNRHSAVSRSKGVMILSSATTFSAVSVFLVFMAAFAAAAAVAAVSAVTAMNNTFNIMWSPFSAVDLSFVLTVTTV